MTTERYLHADGRTATIEMWQTRGNFFSPGGRVRKYEPKRVIDQLRTQLLGWGFSLVSPVSPQQELAFPEERCQM